MRRIWIILYWLFRGRNNVGLPEMIRFLRKPTNRVVASRYIRNIVRGQDFYEVTFAGLHHPLYWPVQFPTDSIYQVAAETFDPQDWHYYQKNHTPVESGEVLLDVGTAEGLFPLTVVEKCRKIIMVEPHPLLYRTLERTFAGHRNKVQLIHSAVGNQTGQLFFEGGSLTGQIAKDGTSGELVQVNKIDDLIPAGEKITFLKADIEGFELPMLQGAAETIRRNRPKIAITCYHNENVPEEIIGFVKGLVPEYNHYVKGITQYGGKPVMIHFWVS